MGIILIDQKFRVYNYGGLSVRHYGKYSCLKTLAYFLFVRLLPPIFPPSDIGFCKTLLAILSSDWDILRAYAHPRMLFSRPSRSLTTALTTIERICTSPYRHWV